MSEAEKILKDIGRQIDELVERAKNGELKEDFNEALEALKIQRDKFEKKVRDMKQKNEPKMQEAKEHLRGAMEELNQAFQKMFRKDSAGKN